MLKRCILALGTIMLATASQLAMANAPIFSDLPDIIIGDADFNQGLTIDLNFFTYVNALNVIQYVSDNDTPPTGWVGTFKEYPLDKASDLEINDKTQLTGPGTNWLLKSTWTASEISGGGTNWYLSFRDLIRSPHRGATPDPDGTQHGTEWYQYDDPKRPGGDSVPTATTERLPWHNDNADKDLLTYNAADGGGMGQQGYAARFVDLYVADEDNVASKGLLVYSVNNSRDDLSGTFTTLFGNAFGGADVVQWDYLNFVSSGFAQATASGGSMTNGYLGLESGLNAGTGAGQGSLFAARWQTRPSADGFTQAIAYIPTDRIYQARYRLALKSNAGSPTGTRNDAPKFRIGIQNAVGAFYSELQVLSATDDRGVGDPEYTNVNRYLPAMNGPQQDFNVFFASLGNTPYFSQLVVGTVDARTWAAYFDVVDKDSEGDSGKWQLDDYQIGHIRRPPDMVTPTSTITDMTIATGGFYNAGSDAWSMVQLMQNMDGPTPAPGKVTFYDPGRNPADPNGGFTFYLLQKADAARWEANKLVRCTVSLSCPTDTDRDNFHKFRIRHNQNWGCMVNTFTINRVYAAYHNPGCPISEQDLTYVDVGPTAYEVYLSPFGGPGGTLLTEDPGLQYYRNWVLGLDALASLNDPDGGDRDLKTTNIVVHKVLYELLDEPAGLP